VLRAAASTTLPAWWDLSSAGCRTGALAVNLVSDPADAVCADWSDGKAMGGLARYCTYGGPCFSGSPSTPNLAKVIVATAVAAANASDLTPGNEYFAFHLAVGNARTTGATACAGCDVPVCLSLSSINVVGADNVGSRLITQASLPGSNTIGWQGGSGAAARSIPGCPALSATPAHHSSWGAVKSMYR
jgi:hypothetical protein